MPKLLVVDDSKFTRSRICAPLRSAGYEIVEAGDGNEALAVLEAGLPDAVLSDLLMPNLDGIGLLTAIRERWPNLPVTICSADVQESSRQACEDLRCNGFLNKPAKPEQILEAVTDMLAVEVSA